MAYLSFWHILWRETSVASIRLCMSRKRFLRRDQLCIWSHVPKAKEMIRPRQNPGIVCLEIGAAVRKAMQNLLWHVSMDRAPLAPLPRVLVDSQPCCLCLYPAPVNCYKLVKIREVEISGWELRRRTRQSHQSDQAEGKSCLRCIDMVRKPIYQCISEPVTDVSMSRIQKKYSPIL
jgi:hypothetical protein